MEPPSNNSPAKIMPWITASARVLLLTVTMMPIASKATAATGISAEVNTPAGLPITQGPGKAHIYGAELELTGAFARLQFNLGTAYLHATVPSDFPFTLPNGVSVTIPEGTTVPFAPEWLATAGVQYSFPVGTGSLTPRLQYQYQGSQYTNIEYRIPLSFPYGELNDVVIPSHSTVDLRLKYAAAANWAIEGYATNLTNKVYISNVILSTGAAAPDISYGAPRQYGARLSYRF